jgi:hypothetical protein
MLYRLTVDVLIICVSSVYDSHHECRFEKSLIKFLSLLPCCANCAKNTVLLEILRSLTQFSETSCFARALLEILLAWNNSGIDILSELIYIILLSSFGHITCNNHAYRSSFLIFNWIAKKRSDEFSLFNCVDFIWFLFSSLPYPKYIVSS